MKKIKTLRLNEQMQTVLLLIKFNLPDLFRGESLSAFKRVLFISSENDLPGTTLRKSINLTSFYAFFCEKCQTLF